MAIERIRDEQWSEMYAFLCERKHVNNYGEANMRRFVEGVHWITRTGAQWRALPEEYGNWNSVYKRFSRWSDAGVWEELFAFIADDPDMESIQIDSTAVRAHPSAAGASAKKGGNSPSR